MTRRRFCDANGTEWSVWAHARVTTSGRESAPRLRFAGGGELRELDTLPREWSDADAWPAAALEALCRTACPVGSRRVA